MFPFSRFLFCIFLLIPPSILNAADPPTVFVSVLPQKFFVQQISKDTMRVEVMVKPGASPATYEPKASQMKKLSTAIAYFAIGVPFEKTWLSRLSGINPEMEIIHTDRGIKRLAMSEHVNTDTAHVEDEDTEHGGLDPHIWLSPSLVKKQAAVIADSLGRLTPEHTQFFLDNLNSFTQQIDALDTELRKILENKRGTSFMVFHPSWGYFADEYGLTQVAVEIEGKSPKPAQLFKLIELAQKKNISVVFAQPQFSRKSAKLIAREIGGNVVTLDPLAENWLENMKVVSEQLKKSMK